MEENLEWLVKYNRPFEPRWAKKPSAKKIYGLFLEHKDGQLKGFVEHSFSMGWSPNSVRVWKSFKDVEYYFDAHTKKEDKEFPRDVKAKYFIARLNSKKSGIKISWNQKSEDKYFRRNARFSKI